MEQYVWDLFEGFWPVSEEYKASKKISQSLSKQDNSSLLGKLEGD